MRAILAVSLLMVSLVHGGAVAAECPPGALGVVRTIVVDPREHARIGAMQYGETLPLNDARPGMLQTQAATTSVFAWLAVYPPPA